jgi:RNA polymerase sigma-70 factor (ECF subfamily)
LEKDNETIWLASARRGDHQAFARLCEAYRHRVWRTVATVTGNGADTDDLAQEAILKAWAALSTYRGDAPFGAWLCRIALNTAHDYVRSAWKRRVFLWGGPRPSDDTVSHQVLEQTATSGPEQSAERNELQRRVRSEVAKLKERERVPIWLIYFEEYSLAEVARLERVPESTVRSRVKAGLKRLERPLADWHVQMEEDKLPDLRERHSDSTYTVREETVLEKVVRPQPVTIGRGYSR